jgi:hypothetical protein
LFGLLAPSDALLAAITDLFRHISRLSSSPPSAADQGSPAPANGTTPAMALLFERVLMPRARLFYAVQQRRTQQAVGSFLTLQLAFGHSNHCVFVIVCLKHIFTYSITFHRSDFLAISRRCSHDRVADRSVR